VQISEASSVLRESHAEHFAYLDKKLKITLTADLDVWPQFIELTQRRHLVAHADGHVSSQYLQICKGNKVSLDAKISLNSKLAIDVGYFNDACDCLAELGFKLSQVLWRKLEPDALVAAEKHLIATTFAMVEAGQYRPAINILTFSLKPPMKFQETRSRLICTINLAQAYKWSGDDKKCGEVISCEDWSATSADFGLSVAVLTEDYKKAAEIMKRIGPTSDQVRKEDYDSWPVFKKFRETPTFLNAYRQIFGT
jgi:hypothetical protein